MPLTGQQGSYLWAAGSTSHSVTVQVGNRDTFAEIALFHVAEGGGGHLSFCQIVQIVSDSGIENFQDIRPLAFRRNVRSVTFFVGAVEADTRARWMLRFWS